MTKNIDIQKQFILVLKISAIAVLIGRAWQFLFWDAPYRALLWDESLMIPIIEGWFNMKWEDWASSEIVNQNIQLSIRFTGVLYVIGIIMILLVNKKRKWPDIILWINVFFLFLLAVLQTKEVFYHVGQFFENSSQVGVIIILISFLRRWLSEKKLLLFIKILIGLTFFSHGLYAINYYPRPGVFVDLMLNTLGTSESFAHSLIFIVGVIDIVIAMMLFIPSFSKISLWYAFFWGLITAFVRVIANTYLDFFWSSMHQSWYLTSYRLVHGLLPLSLLIFQKINDSTLTGKLKMDFRKELSKN